MEIRLAQSGAPSRDDGPPHRRIVDVDRGVQAVRPALTERPSPGAFDDGQRSMLQASQQRDCDTA